MVSRHYENKARRSYWSVHVEAWRRSGLAQEAYCRQHGLSRNTFRRWLAVLEAANVLQIKDRERRRRARQPLSADRRSKAVQAFWAMHVEALNWCGLSLRDYATAHQLSPHSLKRWRDLIDGGDVEIDWRARLHPSARQSISTGASTGAKVGGPKAWLTDASTADPRHADRSVRRRFSDAQKRVIVAESEAPDVSVAAVARRHGIATSMIFRWRVQFGRGREEPARLATVQLTETEGKGRPDALVLQGLLQAPDGMIAIDLPDGRQVFAPAGADPEAVWRQVERRESAP